MNTLLVICMLIGIIALIAAIVFFGAGALGCLFEGLKFAGLGILGIVIFYFIIRGLISIF